MLMKYKNDLTFIKKLNLFYNKIYLIFVLFYWEIDKDLLYSKIILLKKEKAVMIN
jgi:hypothetical protein